MTHDSPTRPRPTMWEASLAVMIFAAVLRLLSPTLTEADLWGHVKYGLDLIATGDLYRADVYSYLSQKWINHEWLSEWVFAVIYKALGGGGLVGFRVLACMGIACVVFRRLRLAGLSVLRAGVLLLLAVLVASPCLSPVRPQIFTYLGWLVVVLAIDGLERGKLGWLWALPPTFALWANLHGGFLAGIGILGIWTAVHVLTDVWNDGLGAALSRRNALIMAGGIASILATLANPYGVHHLIFLLKTATVPRPYIVEWHAVRITSMKGLAYLAMVAVTGAGMIWSRRRRSPAIVAAFLCAVLLPLTAIRHLGLFSLAAAVFAAEHVADVWNRFMPQREPDANTRRPLVVVSILAALVCVASSVRDLSGIYFPPKTYPVRAVALLEDSHAAGNMICYFNWGQYALWHLGPRIKVSIDGRRETVYSDEIYQQNINFTFGQKDWDKLLRAHVAQLALVKRELACFNLMKLLPDWELVYHDAVCGLFARKGTRQLAAVKKAMKESPAMQSVPVDGVGLRFPGP